MIKAKQAFMELLNQKATVSIVTKLSFRFDIKILFIVCNICQKLYFIEIGPIYAKLWSKLCTMMKTLN